MDVIILGSGTAIPLVDRGSPSIALVIDGKPILLDIGFGTLRQLGKVGISYEQVERIFLTHFHPDHTADLIHFLFASKNPTVLSRRKPVVLTGPSGTARLMEALHGAYPDWIRLPPEMMQIEELEIRRDVQRDLGDIRIMATPTNHTDHSLAYRIEDRAGKAVVYSGDTGFCQPVIDLARGADLLILEASFPDGAEEKGHLTPSQAGRMAAMAHVKRLVLTHFYPESLHADIEAQCRTTYGGELTLAEDLMTLRI